MVNVLGYNNQINVYNSKVVMIIKPKLMKIVLIIIKIALQMESNALY